jgi:D-3-phosphoglycerate dehydrogenase
MQSLKKNKLKKQYDTRLNVLVVDPIDKKAIEELEKKFNVTVMLKPLQNELKVVIKDADVIILRSGVQLNESLLESAKKLRVIARAGIGTDNIDLQTARRKGIIVFKVPSESSRSVAELSFGLILAVSRHIVLADSQIRQGVWKKSELSGIELYGKIIGIIGLGSIGSEIAKISQGFGMHVIACVNKHTNDRQHKLAKRGIKLLGLPELLSQADIVCLALPLTIDTENLISFKQLQQMKRTSFLINISRAGIINTNDLIIALQQKIIKGVATDVLPNETGRTPLDQFSNVVLTPHIGAMTEEAQYRIGQHIINGIISALEGHNVSNRVC